MPVELKVPSVGESVTEVEIGEWLKAVGDTVQQDEIIVMLETDKVTVELPAPVSGTITKILLNQGDTAMVGDIVGYLEEGAVASGEAKSSAAALSPSAAPAAESRSVTIPPVSAPRVMPAAQRALHSTGLTAEQVTATGPGGRTLKEDVMAAAAGTKRPAIVPAAEAPVVTSAEGGSRSTEVVPMTLMRRKIAERLVEAQQTAALLTTFNEVDMTAVLALRKQYQDGFVKKYGIKLGFMSFFAKASVDALKLFPSVNSQLSGKNVIYHNYCDIGVAVGGGKGLVVPVLRNVERMGFAEVEQSISAVAKRAKAGTLKLEELQGGTFTITNGGIYGSLLSTPIINPPQSGILGLHNIVPRAMVVNGEVVARPMMYIALTYDHRIVDGREAVSFLKRIKDTIEDPARMLVEI